MVKCSCGELRFNLIQTLQDNVCGVGICEPGQRQSGGGHLGEKCVYQPHDVTTGVREGDPTIYCLPCVGPPSGYIIMQGEPGPPCDMTANDDAKVANVTCGLQATVAHLSPGRLRGPGPSCHVYPLYAGSPATSYYSSLTGIHLYLPNYDPMCGEGVSHECGHSILDSRRPDLYSAWTIQVSAFHEAFASLCLIPEWIHYDDPITDFPNHVSNLHVSNIMSAEGEWLGYPFGSWADMAVLRTYEECLLQTDEHFVAECFAGAAYSYFTDRVDAHGGLNPDGLKGGRNDLCSCLMYSALTARLSSTILLSASEKFVEYAYYVGGGDSAAAAFGDRGLLVGSPFAVADFSNRVNRTEIRRRSQKIRICDVLEVSIKDNHLYDAEIEIKVDDHYYYENRKLLHAVESSLEDEYLAAKYFLDNLRDRNLVGEHGSHQLFPIGNGKFRLERTKIIR